MNRIHSLVWNRALRVLQVASELARSHGGGSSSVARLPVLVRGAIAVACSLALGLGAASPALAANHDFTIAPSGGDETGAQVSSALLSGNVAILSSQGAATGTGNINVDNVIAWASNLLTLTAADNIDINTALNGTGTSAFVLNAATANGADAAVSGGVIGVNANISTGADQTYNGGVVLGTDATLTSTNGGAIDFVSTVDGAHNLTVETGGVATFGGAVGSNTALTSLTTGGGGITVLDGNATTTGAQTYDDVVKLGNNDTLTSTGAGNITFGSTLDSTGTIAQSLTVNTGGRTTFAGDVGDSHMLAKLDVVQGTTVLDGDVSTVADQTFGGPVLLGANVSLWSNAGAVTFNGTVDNASATQQTLSVQADEGSVNFKGAVGASSSGALYGLSVTGNAFSANSLNIGAGGLLVHTFSNPITQNGAFTVAGTSTFETSNQAITLTNADNDFQGVVSLTGGGAQIANNAPLILGSISTASLAATGAGGILLTHAVNTTGTQTYNDAVTLGTGVTTASSGGGNIDFMSTVDGAYALTVNTIGATMFEGAVGGNVPLTSLTTDAGGSTTLDGNITTSGVQTYNDAIALGTGDVVATSTSNGNIDFASTVDGAHGLTVNTGGVTTFGGVVGGNTALASLTTDAAGSTVIEGNVGTTGAQTYNDAVTLGNGVSLGNNLTLASSGNDNITFGSTLDGQQNLTIDTGGKTMFAAGVGDNSMLNSLDVVQGTTVLDGNVSTQATQTYGGSVLLGASVSLYAYFGATFGGTVDNASPTQQTLTVEADDGPVDFGGAVGAGSNGALYGLNVTSGGFRANSLNIGIGGLAVQAFGNSTITQTGAFTVTGTSSFNAASGAITLTNASNDFQKAVSLSNSGANNVSLTNGGSLTLGNVNVGSGALSLMGAGLVQSANTSIVQAAGIGGATLDAGSGALALTNAGNDFTGAVTAIGSGVAIVDGNDLTLAAITDNGNGDVSLTAGGILTLPGSGIDAGTGSLVLESGGSLATAGSLSGGNVFLTDGSGLQLNSNITANGVLDLTSLGGSINQTAGAIAAGTLMGVSSGATVLTAAGNQVSSLDDFSANGFSLNDGGALTVLGTVDGGSAGTALTTSGDLSIAGTVGSGAGNVSLDSSGAMDISGVVNGGNVNLSSSGEALLTGTLDSASGTTLNAGNLQVGNGSLAGTLVGNLALNGSTNGVIFDEPGATTYGGVISGAGTLTQEGPGTLTLDGANTATGPTTVASGSTLLVGDSSHATATVDGDVSVSGGTLGGFGTALGSAMLANGATLAPGAAGSIGTLTVAGDLTIGSGSQLDFDFGAPGPNFSTPGLGDHVAVNGNLSIGTSTLDVNNLGGMGPGLYNLFDWGGSLSIIGGGFAPPSGMSLQILTVDKQINLVDTQGFTLNEWDANGLASPSQLGGGSGTWSVSSNTWSDTAGQYVGPMSPQPGFAIFGGAPGTVTVDDTNGEVSVTGMQFMSKGYILTGGPVDLVASNGVAPIIRVGDGSSAGAGITTTIDSELTGIDGFTKTDAGTLILGGQGTSNALSGAIAVQGGTLLLGNDAGGGSPATFDNVVTMSSGTTLIVDSATLSPGKYGAATTGRTAVSGSGFSVGVGYTGAGNVYGGGGNLGKYSQNGSAGGAAIAGSNFTVINAGGGKIRGGAGGTAAALGGGGAGGAGMYGSDFTATNQSGGKITGGLGGGSGNGTTGAGGVAVGGSGFTLTNASGASLRGGQGGEGTRAGAVGGAGGVGVSGTGFTLVNSGSIYGGPGGNYGVSGQGTPGVGGAGVIGLGGANVTTSGLIAGGLSGVLNGSTTPGTQQANAVEFSGGGNTLTLESGFSFKGNVVSTSGTTNGGDTLALGGTITDTFNVSNIVNALPANATTTQYVGFNQFAKTGSGTWTLTGNGAHAAREDWTIIDGTLQGDATIFAHSVTIAFAPDAGDTAALVFDQGSGNANSPATATFGGLVSGDGSVTKIDDGSLVLTGANTFTGGTTISAGTLQIGNGGTEGSIVGAVTDNGALVFDRSDALTFASVVSGTGALIQQGSGTLTLAGANTFTGGTTIGAGTLAVGNDGALGTGGVDMAAGTTLGFAASGLSLANAFALNGDPAFDVTSGQTDTISGAIADGAIPGTLEKTGAGTLILTGADTYTGGTTISAGTLQIGTGGTAGSIVGDVVDNGALAFERSDAVTFVGAISGGGTLTQQGGVLTLDGNSSAFAGTTQVKAGTLVVGDDAHANAALGGNVTVNAGATLVGIGTLGGLDLSGTLSPGGSIGTLHVTGNATFEQGSTFDIEASPRGTSDRLAVGGRVSIKGGSVVAIAQAGDWAPQTEYTIISAGGGVSGTFGSVSDNLAFLTPVLAYTASSVNLSLQRNDINFGEIAVTPNGKGAATGAGGLGFGNTLYDALVKLDASTARYAFDQTSGEYHASQQTARTGDSRYIREAMNQRLRAGDADSESAKQGDTNLSAWAHAWGHWGTIDSDGNAGRLADNGDGLLIGADMPVGAQGRIGVTGGASRNSLSVGSRASWGQLTSQWLGAFGGLEHGAFALRGGVAYAWDEVPSNREVDFPGYSDRLSGNTSGDTLTGFIEGAWTFSVGQSEIAPFVNLAHTRVETGSSAEAGGAAALDASEESMNVSFSTLGARGSVQFAHDLDVHGELGWQHAFGDTTPQRTLQFVAGGPAFTEYGVPIAKNAGLGKIGVGWHAGRTSIDADYEGLFGDGAKDQVAKLSVSVAF